MPEFVKVEASTPSAERIAYAESLASVHADLDTLEGADGGDPATKAVRLVAAVRRGLAAPVPVAFDEAEVLRLELALRVCDPAARVASETVVELLSPFMDAKGRLPIDAVTARVLVCLGDAAAARERDALAMRAYSSAIRVMTALQQELMP